MLRIEEIREIIKLVDESSIDKFTYEADGGKISLQKNNNVREIVSVPKAVEVVEQIDKDPAVVVPAIKEQPNESADIESPEEKSVDYDYEIVSPMVGTLYSASSPDHDPFVVKGSTISKGTVVCIVEAMKLFNEIESEVSGEIVEILVKDGELIEYGQPLFRVKTK